VGIAPFPEQLDRALLPSQVFFVSQAAPNKQKSSTQASKEASLTSLWIVISVSGREAGTDQLTNTACKQFSPNLLFIAGQGFQGQALEKSYT
jgi:hypothetical protein